MATSGVEAIFVASQRKWKNDTNVDMGDKEMITKTIYGYIYVYIYIDIYR